jgi:hypothetical protein
MVRPGRPQRRLFRACRIGERSHVTGQRVVMTAAAFRAGRMTYQRSRCAALRALQAAVPLRSAEAEAVLAYYRTSSNRRGCRRRCGQLVCYCQRAWSCSWAPISFVPKWVRRSKELQIQASSSVCRLSFPRQHWTTARPLEATDRLFRDISKVCRRAGHQALGRAFPQMKEAAN